ncbi:hypothetical protein [Actinacidiphila sp. bgisy167]|uniref:hypothetical protein n=1 Tax=Actinacidiphila sp. bgisy167 TaxID=3413797 RepID=UPI003D70314F
MSTVFERYFGLLDSDESDPDERFETFFAPDAEVFYGGEYAAGEWIIPFHRRLATRRQHSAHTSFVTADADGVVTADWQETGEDSHGRAYEAGGTATAWLDASGRITRLKVLYADHSDLAWRVIRAHNQAWRETDPDERQTLIKDAYAEDFTFVEHYVVEGRDACSEWVAKIHEAAPVALLQVGEVLRNRDDVLWQWFLAMPDSTEVEGWETQHVDVNGKIDRIVVITRDMETIVGGAS